MNRSWRNAFALPALLAVVLVGCNSDGDDDGGAGPTPSSAQSESPIQPTDAEVVSAVEVTAEDLPEGYGANKFGDRGDLVDGYVTLDLCGATFASEDLRTARHQVGYSGPDDDWISSETVTYGPGGAEQAMGELRDAVSNCPKGFVDSTVAGQPKVKQRIDELPVEPDWQEDTVAMRIAVTPETGPSSSGALIYQRRGDAITAVYVFAEPESAELAAGFASLLSDRLETAAPGSATTS